MADQLVASRIVLEQVFLLGLFAMAIAVQRVGQIARRLARRRCRAPARTPTASFTAAGGLALDHLEEILAMDDDEPRALGGGRGQRAHRAIDERHLAEVMAAPDLGDRRVVLRQPHAARQHNVHRVAGLALAEDDLLGLELDRVGDRRDLHELLVREVAEHLHRLQDFELERDLARARDELGRLRLADAHDDRGDVVVAALAVRELDQLLRDFLDLAGGELRGQVGFSSTYAYMPSLASRKRSPGRMSKSNVSTSTELRRRADRARDRVLVLLVRRAIDLLAVELCRDGPARSSASDPRSGCGSGTGARGSSASRRRAR